ncbi:MAG: hypothetical protein K8T26_01890 [Lentisphaerae bacterium]|nr:hypothetical protein [Lentisphaerota bacterium]
MRDAAMLKAVQEICTRDRRYRPESYLFVLDALEFTTKVLQKSARSGKERHVGGRELLEGLRHFALQEFGPMALRVLNTWGVKRSEDFGEIVFNLVESGKLRKTEEDSRQDFAGGYDFTEAFAVPFLPASKPEGAKRVGRTPRASGEGGKRKATPPAPPAS